MPVVSIAQSLYNPVANNWTAIPASVSIAQSRPIPLQPCPHAFQREANACVSIAQSRPIPLQHDDMHISYPLDDLFQSLNRVQSLYNQIKLR